MRSKLLIDKTAKALMGTENIILSQFFSDCFKKSLHYGTMFAVLTTYFASTALHGLNFQLGAVLFSLGFYTYTEHRLLTFTSPTVLVLALKNFGFLLGVFALTFFSWSWI